MKKISFIVPVYNVRDYVIRCLTSLVNQNIPHSDYEIIVVIDGSPDDSLQLVTKFAQGYSNITIIDQENVGLSQARNNGFGLATGKYTWFIDSDDWITQNCLKELLAVADSERLDMFCVGPSIQAQEDFKLYFKKEALSETLSGKEKILLGDIVIGVWCYIFRTDFLIQNSLAFYKGIYFEDEEFTPRALFFADRVMSLTTFSVYFYFIRENSICNTYSDKHVFDSLKVAKSLLDFVREKELSGNLKGAFNDRIKNNVLAGFKRCDVAKIRSCVEVAKELLLYPFRCSFGFSKRCLLLHLWNIFPSLVKRIQK